MDKEFIELEKETAKLAALTDELMRYIRNINVKTEDYLSRLQVEPLPAE